MARGLGRGGIVRTGREIDQQREGKSQRTNESCKISLRDGHCAILREGGRSRAMMLARSRADLRGPPETVWQQHGVAPTCQRTSRTVCTASRAHMISTRAMKAQLRAL